MRGSVRRMFDGGYSEITKSKWHLSLGREAWAGETNYIIAVPEIGGKTKHMPADQIV